MMVLTYHMHPLHLHLFAFIAILRSSNVLMMPSHSLPMYIDHME